MGQDKRNVGEVNATTISGSKGLAISDRSIGSYREAGARGTTESETVTVESIRAMVARLGFLNVPSQVESRSNKTSEVVAGQRKLLQRSEVWRDSSITPGVHRYLVGGLGG